MNVCHRWLGKFAATKLSVWGRCEHFTWNFNLNFNERTLLLQFVSCHRCDVIYAQWHSDTQKHNWTIHAQNMLHVVWLLGNLEWTLKPSNLIGFKLWLWTSIGTLIMHGQCANTLQRPVRQHWPMAPAPKVSSLNWSISSSSSISPSSSSSNVQSSSRDCKDSGEDRWWDKET